jgi:D-glycero-D-manno-heptose 1,7-bisphosphate phosphatase
MKANKAVFLDRDGVINRPIIVDGKPYPPRTAAEFEILPGVDKACADLKKGGYLLVVATNQPDVGRGILKKEAVEAIHAAMVRQLPIDRVEVCYHAGARFGEECECRKPRPGMLLQAAAALDVDLTRSFMIGDRWRDVDCGKRAGCRTVFIDWGYKETLREQSDFRATGLLEASELILHVPETELATTDAKTEKGDERRKM